MAAISVAILVDDPHESFIFRQKRIGLHGVPFTLYKFRTMKCGATGATITVKNDKRLTKIGKFLRRFKFDELPQLWNVLKGDMSFVGPRPDVEGYANNLSGADRIILELKPGITGPATLKYSREEELLSQQADPQAYNDNVIWPDKVRINKDYAVNHNFILDLKIIFRTLHLLK